MKLETMTGNVKSGIRFIRKAPGFSITIILTLALGIGVNSAVFSAIDAILLKPLPFPNSNELMTISQYDRTVKSPTSFVAPVRLRDWNRLNTTFQAITGYYTEDVSESSGTLPEKLTEALVAPRFLQVWGVSPELGRDFAPKEEHFGATDAVLISDRFWRRRFGADPNVLGKRLRIENYSFTIIGVMPASFLFPERGVDLWTAVPMDAPYAQSRDSTWFKVIGRLKPGVTPERARANLAAVQAELGRQFPKTDGTLGVKIEPLKEVTVGGARRSLWVLFGSVSLLLLIACTNIAALLLARTTERAREISIRFSLGAGRLPLIGQLLTECFLLAILGSAAGLFLAAGAAKVFRVLAKSLPRVEEITLDWRIVVYTLGCAVVATLLCGVIPAIRATRQSLSTELARASRTQVSTRNPAQWLLVGVQVALAVTLLVGAGLLLRSFQELGHVSPGFDASRALTLRITGNYGETADFKKLTARIDRTLDVLRATPGVEAAATSTALPGVPGDYRTELKLVEGQTDPQRKVVADSRFVSNEYLQTMRIPLLAGEDCRPGMNSAGVFVTDVLVNRSFANTYLGGSPAIGHHVEFSSGLMSLPPSAIRGVVADAREQGINREPMPTVYWCMSAPDPTPFFLIRTRGEPLAMAGALRRKIHQLEPSRSVFDLSSLDRNLYDSFGENRLRAILLTFFAFTAVSLACVGLYGTLSYFVALRRREIGLRLALGAMRGGIIKRFLFEGVGVASLGCIAGLCLAAASARLLASMLYGVSTADATTFSGVVVLILAVATAASLVPAARAARVEPIEVLREE